MSAPMDNDSSPRLVNGPEDCLYTPFYCEENIWKLCEYVQNEVANELDRCWVVYISNDNRAVPLWNQRASKSPQQPVVWDYHVVLVHEHSRGCMVYDLDSCLPYPSTFHHYSEHTIHSEEILKSQYQRLFRVIHAADYLRHFASDRRHMIGENGDWQKSPPPYPCLQTPESVNNIDDFISMDPSVGWGSVLTHQQFIQRFIPS